MCNSTVIAVVEGAMNAQMRYEWIKQVAGKAIASVGKFNRLREFLEEWRNRLEYDSAGIREIQPITGKAHHTDSYHPAQQKQQRDQCWFHKASGSVGEHPIWKCRLILNQSPAERMSSVVSNQACQRCLEKRCPGSAEISQCPRTFRCPVANCGAIHNRLLHENAATTGSSHQLMTTQVQSLQM